VDLPVGLRSLPRIKCTIKYRREGERVEQAMTTKGPVTQKGRDVRDRIVREAARLMQEQGVSSTSLEDIEAAAAAGRSQLYYYFSGKKGLVEAVIHYQAEGILTSSRTALGLSTWEAWEDWRTGTVRYYALHSCKGGCPLGSLASELADTHEEARHHLSLNFRRWEQIFHDGLQSMKSAGLLDDAADPKRLAVVLITSLEGGLLMSQTHRDVTYLDVALEGALRLVRHHARAEWERPSGWR